MLVNLLCGRQYDSALLSQVFHTYLAYLRNILLIRYILVKEITGGAENYYLDSNTLIGVYAVTYDVNDTKTQRLSLHALRARMGASEEQQNRARVCPKCKSPYYNRPRKLKQSNGA